MKVHAPSKGSPDNTLSSNVVGFLGISREEENPATVLPVCAGNEKYPGGVEALWGCFC